VALNLGVTVAVSNPPAFLQAGTYPASLDRLHLISAAYQPLIDTASVGKIAARGGILAGQPARRGNFSITGSWTIGVNPWIAVVPNGFAADAGDYSVIQSGNLSVVLTASSPTTNRIDIVGVRVQDAFYTGAVNAADLAVIQGTPTAGTPSDPALPASFLPLFRATVNANSSAPILADLRKSTVANGGINPIFSAEQPNNGISVGEVQVIPVSGVYPQRLRIWDGTTWRGVSPFAFDVPAQSGSGTLPAGGNGAVIASLSVADPGFPYRLKASGQIPWAVIGGASTVDHTMWATVTLDQTIYNLGIVAGKFNVATPGLVAGNSQPTAVAGDGHTAQQTGAHTLRLIARNNHGSASYTVPASTSEYRLAAELLPT
jgi:hypothetical protein